MSQIKGASSSGKCFHGASHPTLPPAAGDGAAALSHSWEPSTLPERLEEDVEESPIRQRLSRSPRHYWVEGPPGRARRPAGSQQGGPPGPVGGAPVGCMGGRWGTSRGKPDPGWAVISVGRDAPHRPPPRGLLCEQWAAQSGRLKQSHAAMRLAAARVGGCELPQERLPRTGVARRAWRQLRRREPDATPRRGHWIQCSQL